MASLAPRESLPFIGKALYGLVASRHIEKGKQ